MALITIITPAYNRGSLLNNLYASLEKQNSHDFEWLVVDDGSVDDSEKVMEDVKRKASFPVRYIYKQNGGKHTALNVGIQEINTPLTMIVDSDDILLPDAIAEITRIYRKYETDKTIGVYSFLRCYSNGKAIVGLEEEEFVTSYIRYRIKENRPGDMAEVFRTEVLKEFPFPEFPGERFLSEDVVWIPIGLKYQYVFINKPIYQCEYLEGGLTDNDKKMKFASPLGSMMRGKQLMNKECGIKVNIKGAIIYNAYDIVPGARVFCDNFRQKMLVFLMKPLGKIFRKKWSK